MTTIDTSPVPDYRQLARLDGRNFVVIGGGQGIGRQAAHALSQHGARVAIVGRSHELTEAVAREVGGLALLGDATVRGDVERIFDAAQRQFGAVHGIVDTLGMVRRKSVAEFDDDDFAWQENIVLRHAILATQIGAPLLASAGGGTITFVGSTAGLAWVRNHTVYGAYKAALHQWVAGAAMEHAADGVRINVVTPCVVRTPRVQGYLDAGRGRKAVDYYPLGRLALPADVAGAILFLSTGLSAYITGQMLLAEGGLLAQCPMPDTVWFE